MDQERTINKLLFNIREEHVDVATALQQAYAAGYDKGHKEGREEVARAQTAHLDKEVILFDKDWHEIGRFNSITEVANKYKVNRDGLYKAISGKTFTRKGFYIKHAS